MTRKSESYDDMLRGLTTALIVNTGSGEKIAQHYARAAMDYLQDQKAANGTLYVPAPPRQFDVMQIRAALERGDKPRKVCRDYSISRRALYRLFPGGLPQPIETKVA